VKSAWVVFALFVISATVACRASQKSASQQGSALEELHAGAREFLAGRYADAETRFRRAQALDPSYKYTQLLIARTLHAQYKSGDSSPENIARGRRAIEAYEKFLESEPASYFAIGALQFLYSKLNEVERNRQLLRRSGTVEGLTKGQRAQIYGVLAGMEWECAFGFTEQPTHKQTVNENGKQTTRYVSAGDAAGLSAAKACATSGLDAADKSLALDPDNASVWSYKTNLFLEMAKLAEMEGQSKTSFTAQATEAEKRALELSKQESKQQAPASASDSLSNIGSIATGDSLLDEVLHTPYHDPPRPIAPPR
jgi:tetratricopeptide (TPR) repeat protein